MPEAPAEKKIEEKRIFEAQPLKGVTLLWSEWRERMKLEMSLLLSTLSKGGVLKGVTKTFANVIRGLLKR